MAFLPIDALMPSFVDPSTVLCRELVTSSWPHAEAMLERTKGEEAARNALTLCWKR